MKTQICYSFFRSERSSSIKGAIKWKIVNTYIPSTSVTQSDILIQWSNSCEFHGTPWRSMESDAVVSMKFRGTFPLNPIEIDGLIPHGMPWKFFPRNSMEFHGGISYGMYQVI